MSRTVHVFTGPTLSAAGVHAVIPSAAVHPPVAAGDLLALPIPGGDVVVIIDGYFQQAQSVRHKEILLLLERGVEVWGAASMGALRGAELHRLGMRGAGAVFRLYARGAIEGDDEVGVTHGPAELGYPVVADALVNVRFTLRRAVRDGLLDRATADAFAAAAAATPFTARTEPGLVAAAVAAGIDAAVAERVATVLREHRVDVKRRDALHALRLVARAGAAAPTRAAHTVSNSAHLHLWTQRARVSRDMDCQGEAAPVTDRQVLAACQLFAADYAEFAAPVALRTLAALAAPPPRRQATDAALLDGLCDDAGQLDEFLAAHHLDRDEVLRHLGREERLAAAMAGGPASATGLAHLVLAEADRRGVLAARDAARWERTWLRADERGAPDCRLLAARRALAVAPGLALHDPFVVALKLSGDFAAARRLARAALAFNDEVAAAHPDFAVHRIDGARVLEWFAQRWGVEAADFDMELADRGFASRDEFVAVAKPFYMSAKFRAVDCTLRLCGGAQDAAA